EDDKTLYALGLSIGGNVAPLKLSQEEIGIIEAGLSDAASGATPRVELKTYGPKISQLLSDRASRGAAAEKEKSKGFLDQAAQEKGAVRTASGLVYVETQKGTGATPTAQDVVKVNYRGELTDGTEFDSSYKRGQPAQFPLNGVIPCWTEGLQKMAVGGKAKLICPSDIAYGDAGRPPVIPPGATLVFEVELLDIVKQ
ncbi:MAG TPA: FKBP-type peptidyl-prolyl cis-trans isomerase, partial [Candidatus Polarisedimenticolia bacterium]|nr:FKBP-type peptidyl-prolyl cis-trans isomerase [Candidatus Polarisedimenticolia bacterium]